MEHLDSGCLKVTRFGADVAPIGDKLVMRKGDVLFGKRRAYQKKVAIAPFDGIFSAHGMVLRPRENVVDPQFFPFFISSDYFLDAAIKISVGSLSPTINWRDLKNLEFNLPTLDEQSRLASVLQSITDTIETYKNLLTRTDELAKSQFIELFGDPVENDRKWPITQLAKIADIKIGPFGSLLHRDDYIEGVHSLINPSHIIDGIICADPALSISESKYNELSAYWLNVGDIVMGRRGEMGRCAVVKNKGLLCGTGCLVIRLTRGMKPYFLQQILSQPDYRRIIEQKAVGVTMLNLNTSIVASLEVPLLPEHLQDQFISFIEQLDKSKFELEQALSELTLTYKRVLAENLG